MMFYDRNQATIERCEDLRLDPPEYRPTEQDVRDSEKAYNRAMEEMEDLVEDLLGLHDSPGRGYMTLTEDHLLQMQGLIGDWRAQNA